MGHYSGDSVAINIGNYARPVKKAPYRVNPKHTDLLDREISTLLEQGVVEESYGDWASPGLVVLKPGRPGEIRLVVDYRAVNKLVQKDAHPLPRMDDAFANVASKKPRYFSSLDLQSGYFQIDLEPDSRKFTRLFLVPMCHDLMESSRGHSCLCRGCWVFI